MRNDPAERPDAARVRLFSIGHSGHSLDHFLALLGQAGGSAVADVRSHPYSGWLPQFNRPDLREALRAQGIAYLFLGDALGGRPEQASLYDEDGRVNYERVRATDEFRRGLDQLCASLADYRVAMLCAEEDPLDCHRGLMITPALAARDLRPAHIRADGRLESTEEMEARLLDMAGLGADPFDELFGPPGAEEHARRLAEAYRRQAQRKAFRLRPGERAVAEGDLLG
jgi:uncharacterized protein (DUF488 family)